MHMQRNGPRRLPSVKFRIHENDEAVLLAVDRTIDLLMLDPDFANISAYPPSPAIGDSTGEPKAAGRVVDR